jgi:hypothetical protein
MLHSGAKVTQKCVMAAQKCAIMGHVAHRPERLQRRLAPEVAAAIGDDVPD